MTHKDQQMPVWTGTMIMRPFPPAVLAGSVPGLALLCGALGFSPSVPVLLCWTPACLRSVSFCRRRQNFVSSLLDQTVVRIIGGLFFWVHRVAADLFVPQVSPLCLFALMPSPLWDTYSCFMLPEAVILFPPSTSPKVNI